MQKLIKMLNVKPINSELEAELMRVDVGFVPKEQECLLRNFEMFSNKEITEKERNRIDAMLLSNDPESVTLGVKIVEAKMNKNEKGSLERT